jgi:sortase A
LSFSGLSALWYLSFSASGAQKLEDPDNSFLTTAVWPALQPSNYVAHRGELLGVLQVQRLSLAVPVVEGSDQESLKTGAGHVEYTVLPGLPGNVGIAAHRDTTFGALRFIKRGDDVAITTPAGIHHYRVTAMTIVYPEDVQVLDPTPNRSLTLVTCYPFHYVGHGPQRFIVHAEAVAGS